MRYLLIILSLIAASFTDVDAQITIGSHTDPNENSLLDLNGNGDGTSNKGLLFPRVALISLDNPSPLSSHVQGMIVYNTTTSDSSTATESAVSPGNYYNDGNKWTRMSDSDTSPWNNIATQAVAKGVDESIDHTGAISIGSSKLDETAELQVSSSTKGLLIPRLTNSDRDNISNPANGLIIYNTTTDCINYYVEDYSKWISLCGGYDKATINIDCSKSKGPAGYYMVGTDLNTKNGYTLSVNVTEIGTYQFEIQTGNGYTFSKSGLFTTTGTYDIVLRGQGTPIKEGEDAVAILNNGYAINMNCTLPSVTVNPAIAVYTLNSYEVYGDYYTQKDLNESNYIEVEVDVTSPGALNIQSSSENGIMFSSGDLVVEPGVQKIKLYGHGKPLNSGKFTGNTITDGTGTQSLNLEINVIRTLGSFEDPADRCQQILDEVSTSGSNYYWIKDSDGNKFMTYCLMDNGEAWTLIRSLSERQMIVVEKTQNESMSTQKARNLVTKQDGVFNEYAFSLSSATVNNIGNSSLPYKYKFTIKEKGHTTAQGTTMDQVETTTVNILNDSWAKDNYWNVTVYQGNPSSTNFVGNATNNTTEGKIFGKSLAKPSNTSANYFFDGIQFRANPYGFYSSANFFTGFYGDPGAVVGNNATANNVTYTYHDSENGGNGKTFTYNKYYINDLFGLYLNNENQLNHHIGTCSNSDDDFGGASYCNSGWANWRPHKFNKNASGEYEGRIFQTWVK